jgi:hypothetical protein
MAPQRALSRRERERVRVLKLHEFYQAKSKMRGIG